MTTTLEVSKVTVEGDFKAHEERPQIKVFFEPEIPLSDPKPYDRGIHFVLEQYIIHGKWRIQAWTPRDAKTGFRHESLTIALLKGLESGDIPDLDLMLSEAKAIADAIPTILLEWGQFYEKTAERLGAMGFKFQIDDNEVKVWLNDEYAFTYLAIMRSLKLDGVGLEGAPLGARATFTLNDFNEAEVKEKLLEHERSRQEKHKEYEVNSTESTAYERSQAAKKAIKTRADNKALEVLRQRVDTWNRHDQ
jgi:hypothetical protein